MKFNKSFFQELRSLKNVWLITGVAGFIGSNLLEHLLNLDQLVIGLDNFSTGSRKNLGIVKDLVTDEKWKNFEFVEGDIRNFELCKSLVAKSNCILHQAALGSVPRSIKDPSTTHEVNVTGFLNMINAARLTSSVKSFVFASSSSVYGNNQDLPKKENKIGHVLSPYAASKRMNEIYADVFFKSYNFKSIGLRYFNVFGPRQDPAGEYAAVIPKWIDAISSSEDTYINGDGETSRDFCYIENVVSANILASFCLINQSSELTNNIFNVGNNSNTTLNTLHKLISEKIAEIKKIPLKNPIYRDFREGDVRHSQADINLAKSVLGYEPIENIVGGIEKTVKFFLTS